MVSYHTTTGYSYDGAFPPCEGPFQASGGFYCYGEPPCAPASAFGLNYWVDFEFAP